MAAFHFELVSPERLLFSGPVEQVVVPGTEGEFTVLKDHAPTMSMLRAGIVTIAEAAGTGQRLFVHGGFAEVSAKGLTILAEEAVPVEQIDPARLEAQIQNLVEDIADAKTEAAKTVAMEKLGQLREVKTILQI